MLGERHGRRVVAGERGGRSRPDLREMGVYHVPECRAEALAAVLRMHTDVAFGAARLGREPVERREGVRDERTASLDLPLLPPGVGRNRAHAVLHARAPS